ncbi:MAG: DNA recombination protein RmuC, partial [Candidatus Aminicenantes bacterium]|nr:DNA recombination protein RmuC [Candidatus Aminicenantes bacterium]
MSMELLIIIAAAFFAVLLFVLFFVFIKNTTNQFKDIKQAQTDDKAMTLMQQQIGQLTTNLNQQLQYINSQFQMTTGQIGTALGDVRKDMEKMEAATREVLDKAKNIANLENLLRAPKFRGGLGELFLGDLLSQILPAAHYNLQHKFKSGEIVDAVIKIGQNLVPIDSKFPLENFKKYVSEEDEKLKGDLKKRFTADVKKHVGSIAEKYILPDEGTYDFALMYIPAENVYYEIILKDDKFSEDKSIFAYCTQKKVIPVSPNSFYAYLQVVVLGLKGLQIEKSAKEIFQSLTRLQRDLGRFKKDFQILGSHLTNAKSKYDDADKRLDKFSGRLEILSGEPQEQLPESVQEESTS